MPVPSEPPPNPRLPTSLSPNAPVRADAQTIRQQAAQKLAVVAVLGATDLADAVQAAEGAGVRRATKSHELVRDHLHCDVLVGGRGGEAGGTQDTWLAP